MTITDIVEIKETFIASGCQILTPNSAGCVLTDTVNQAYWLILGDLDDSAVVLAGPAATTFNQLDGGSGKDVLIGGPGADQLRGGEGDDMLNGMGGDDGFTAEDGQTSSSAALAATASATPTGTRA